MDVLYLIVVYIEGNIDKKFQPSIFYKSRENQLWKKAAEQQSDCFGYFYT